MLDVPHHRGRAWIDAVGPCVRHGRDRPSGHGQPSRSHTPRARRGGECTAWGHGRIVTWFGIFLVGLGVAQAALAWHDGRRTPPRSWSERTFLYGNLSGAGIITVVGLVAMFTH